LRGEWIRAEAARPDHGRALDELPIAQGDAILFQRRDAHTEPRLHAGLAQRLLDQWTRIGTHRRRDGVVAVDDDDADVRLWPEERAQSRRHFGGHLDAGEAAAADDRRVAGGRGWPVRQGGEMVVECDCVIDLIDGEAVLVEARDVRLEPLAAGSQHQAVVGQRAPLPVGPDDPGRLAGGVDDVDPALFVSDVEGLEEFPKRCHHGLGRALVEAGTDHQPRLRRDDDDLEGVG
jgi:hypothetical protein